LRRLLKQLSRHPWLETVLVMKAAKNRRGDDAVAFANPMAADRPRLAKDSQARTQGYLPAPQKV